jgi:hypothetical protein
MERQHWLSRRAMTVASMAALLGGCGAPEGGSDTTTEEGGRNETWSLTYRITIRTVADGRRREGSSVFRTIYERISNRALIQAGRFRTQTWGEAIAIDMGGGRYLFGLLGDVSGVRSSGRLIVNHPRSVIDILPREESTGEAYASGAVFERVARLRGEHEWPRSAWPVLVNFTNRSDRTTAAFVPWPGENSDVSGNTPVRSLAAAFGRDAMIEGMSIEITDAAVTERIMGLLPWVAQMPGADGNYHVSGGDNQILGERLDYRNFKLAAYPG